jgi:hypothetical protein
MSSDGQYFNYVQPYEHHTNKPSIYTYSFALHPEQHQPSGFANVSHIDSYKPYYLTYNFKNKVKFVYALDKVNYFKVSHNRHRNFTEESTPTHYINYDNAFKVYAHNYNILKVMSGLGGLAYSS